MEDVQAILASATDVCSVLNLEDEKGRTALALACVFGRQDVVRVLLSFGAEVSVKGHHASCA